MVNKSFLLENFKKDNSLMESCMAKVKFPIQMGHMKKARLLKESFMAGERLRAEIRMVFGFCTMVNLQRVSSTDTVF